MEKLFLTLTAFFIIFSGCVKKEKNTKQHEGSRDNAYLIEVKRKDGIKLDIDSIKAEMATMGTEKRFIVLDQVEFKQEGFVLHLPQNLNAEHLTKIDNVLMKEHSHDYIFPEIEESDVYLSNIVRINAYKEGSYVGNFSMREIDCGGDCEVIYFYCDRPFNLNGNYEKHPYIYLYDLNLDKGWNQMYLSFLFYKTPISLIKTTTIPDNLEWYFRPNDSVELL